MLFQLRSALAYRYFEYRTRGIDRTPPLTSDAASPCEVHTMLGARDVTMYLLAIKSLLTHVPGLSVVVHSDGSLGDAEMSMDDCCPDMKGPASNAGVYKCGMGFCCVGGTIALDDIRPVAFGHVAVAASKIAIPADQVVSFSRGSPPFRPPRI